MELLADPLQDRPVKSLQPPVVKPMDHSLLFPEKLKSGNKEIPDWEALKTHLEREGKMNKADMV